MSTQPCLATARAISGSTPINVRSGPGIQNALVMTVASGTAAMRVLDVQPDERGDMSNGFIFQWFKVTLANGGSGWIREDLVEIVGDCTPFGYSRLSTPTRANTLFRSTPVDPSPDPDPKPIDPIPDPTPDAEARARKAAFNITAAFEGGGYATYQNYDSGIVSFGRYQSTLASGSLNTLLTAYLAKATSAEADQLRRNYAARVRAKDATLRNDATFRALLIASAADPVMRAAQDEQATNGYWTPIMNDSAIPRGVVTALGQAFIFDMAINHGRTGAERTYLRPAELALGVAERSRVGTNGITEAQLITRAVQLRRDRLYAIAAARNLGGLRVRADFWVNVVNTGDWSLQGDANGLIEVKRGARVQVRNP